MKRKWIGVVAIIIALPVIAGFFQFYLHLFLPPLSVSGQIHLDKPNARVQFLRFLEDFPPVMYRDANFTQTEYHVVLPNGGHTWRIFMTWKAENGTNEDCLYHLNPPPFGSGSNVMTYDIRGC